MADAPVTAAPAAAPVQAPTTTPDPVTGQPQVVQPGQEAAPTKAEVKRIKSLKLKIDGNEVDEALPFEMDDTPENREYMQRHIQMSKMGSKRAQEAADLRKQVDGIRDYLSQAKGNKTKLRSLIKELGGDEKELAAAIIEEEIANSQKSPEQLQREQLENELKELKEQREREKQEFSARELERLQNQEMERYDVLVSQALEKSELPKKPGVVRKMADYMLLALENGIDLTPNEVAEIVKQELFGDMQEIMSALGEDKVESFVGKEMLGKIRKKNIAKAKAAGTPAPSAKKGTDIGAPATAKAEVKPGEKKTIKQLWGI